MVPAPISHTRRLITEPDQLTTAEKPRGSSLLRSFLIIESRPILFPMLHQCSPRFKTRGYGLVEHIKDKDVGLRNVGLFSSSNYVDKHFWLCDKEFGFGGFDVMGQLELGVSWIGP